MSWQLIPKNGENYNCAKLQIGDFIQFYNLANDLLQGNIISINYNDNVCWIDAEAGFLIRKQMIVNAYRWETEPMDVDRGGGVEEKNLLEEEKEQEKEQKEEEELKEEQKEDKNII